ncbi:methyltransferase N6AMT1 [Chironomus tepperi]|uniref:methyltransferase N6AMT1 n=1 Tax=Chironomus tepperi TaxID=113505 RepID=UPI00391FB895
METPIFSHLTSDDYENVYEPAEDTFVLLDALELELSFLKSQKPLIVAEIGIGSGIVISALSKYLDYQSFGFFGIDINEFACDAATRTAKKNNVNVEVINMDLLTSFKKKSIDLLVFNPPYVVTDYESDSDGPEWNKCYDDEAEKMFARHDKKLIKSWAGGVDGCEVINRVIFKLNEILSPNGIFYLVLIKDNNPAKIREHLDILGFDSHQIIERKIRGEHLLVLKITRKLTKCN